MARCSMRKSLSLRRSAPASPKLGNLDGVSERSQQGDSSPTLKFQLLGETLIPRLSYGPSCSHCLRVIDSTNSKVQFLDIPHLTNKLTYFTLVAFPWPQTILEPARADARKSCSLVGRVSCMHKETAGIDILLMTHPLHLRSKINGPALSHEPPPPVPSS